MYIKKCCNLGMKISQYTSTGALLTYHTLAFCSSAQFSDSTNRSPFIVSNNFRTTVWCIFFQGEMLSISARKVPIHIASANGTENFFNEFLIGETLFSGRIRKLFPLNSVHMKGQQHPSESIFSSAHTFIISIGTCTAHTQTHRAT